MICTNLRWMCVEVYPKSKQLLGCVFIWSSRVCPSLKAEAPTSFEAWPLWIGLVLDHITSFVFYWLLNWTVLLLGSQSRTIFNCMAVLLSRIKQVIARPEKKVCAQYGQPQLQATLCMKAVGWQGERQRHRHSLLRCGGDVPSLLCMPFSIAIVAQRFRLSVCFCRVPPKGSVK